MTTPSSLEAVQLATARPWRCWSLQVCGITGGQGPYLGPFGFWVPQDTPRGADLGLLMYKEAGPPGEGARCWEARSALASRGHQHIRLVAETGGTHGATGTGGHRGGQPSGTVG